MTLNTLLRRPRFKLPRHRLGADLFWWRETADLHTLVTICPPNLTNGGLPPAHLMFVLFDAAGTATAEWTHALDDARPVVVDSRRVFAEHGRDVVPEEGTLAAFVVPESKPPREAVERYTRLFSLVDWYSDGGELVSLHNDQAISPRDRPIEFTEIVFRELEDEHTFLVLLGGDEPQPPGCLTLEVRNHTGEIRSCIYHEPMPPFSVNTLVLADLFPSLEQFCDGRHATLTGSFGSTGLFTRPYVMSTTPRLNGYHGGDRYEWDPMPRDDFERLAGRGFMNPMVVLNTDEVRTTVNLLNTHGHLEEDAWVDAWLYDEAGTLVKHCERWLCARRNQLARGDVVDLLPSPDQHFVGHIALNYTPDDRAAYPPTVQALMEYRTDENVARVMAWADEWNSAERLAADDITLGAFYRVLCDDRFLSYLAITNSGVDPHYDRTAEYTIRLRNVRGEERTFAGSVGPQATIFEPIDFFFTDVQRFLGDAPAAVVVVESTLDLALMHFTKHRRSGVWSAEHFMSLATEHGGELRFPCGS